MKRLLLTVAFAGSIPGLASAQADTTTAAPTAGDMFRAESQPLEIRASDLIGMRVYASETPLGSMNAEGVQGNWEDIGEVNDAILSREGRIEAVLVDIGGFLGMGERQVAVDMSSLNFVSDDATADVEEDFFLVLNADRGALEGAPPFAWRGADGTVANPAANADAGAAATGAAQTDAAAGADTAAAGGSAAGAAGGDGAMTETAANDPLAPEGFDSLEGDQVSVEALTAAEVYDSTGDSMGDVSDLVVDDSGKITHVVIDVGGFLGIGEKTVALPLDEAKIMKSATADEVRVYVSQTEEQLKEMDTFRN